MGELNNEIHQDQQNLIHDHASQRVYAPIGGAGRFLTIKFSVILIYLFGVAFNFYPSVQLFFVTLAAVFEFWLCKNNDGLELVGMRWSHEIGDGGDPQWVFYSRPDPYVPMPLNSTMFWTGLFGGSFLWFCICFWALFQFSGMNLMIAMFVFGLHLVNSCCFWKCHNVSTKQADDVARSVLLGNRIENDGHENPETTSVYNQDTTEIHLDIKAESDSDQ